MNESQLQYLHPDITGDRVIVIALVTDSNSKILKTSVRERIWVILNVHCIHSLSLPGNFL